jgi:hypothetical protein
MGIRKNPYDVGYAERKIQDLPGRCCDCCGVHVAARGVPGYDPTPDCCVDCADHYRIEGEPIERELTRLRAHDGYHREYVKKVREHANQVEAKYRENREAVSSALAQRGNYRDALVAVRRLHKEEAGGLCRCGQRAPCPTTRAIDDADGGVVSWVDREAAFLDSRE